MQNTYWSTELLIIYSHIIFPIFYFSSEGRTRLESKVNEIKMRLPVSLKQKVKSCKCIISFFIVILILDLY
jgi:hypothetical protein